MNENRFHIKNMVCQRCILAVKSVLRELEVEVIYVKLGEVLLERELNEVTTEKFNNALVHLGFELLESDRSSLIEQIKTLIIEQVHHQNKPLKENFSFFISDKLHHEYSYLSRLFSSVEGMTIEKFVTKQKVEKVKELLFYNEKSLSEIAFDLGYSSSSYLSTQFKKETGMTPTQFKSSHSPGHKGIDSL